MFERFTTDARDIVVTAQTEARALDHCWIGAEHLMLGVLARPEAAGVPALLRLGVTQSAWRAGIVDLLGATGPQQPPAFPGGADRDPLAASDAEALSTLGIDVEEVRRRVEAAFGPGALAPRRKGPRLRLGRRRRRCNTVGHIPLTDRAKRGLERSLREASALGDRHIGVEHILLGLLDPKGNLAVALLEQFDLTPEQVRAAVLADIGKAA